jgi:excisionase family DNA binding protein
MNAYGVRGHPPQIPPDSGVVLEPSVLTPEEVAARWKCSPSHVRRLVSTHKLQAFRLGGKLLRIPLAAVEAFECASTSSNASVADGSSPATRVDKDSQEIAFLRLTQQKRRDNSTD